MTEDETVGWHDRLNEHEFGQTPGDSEGQGSLTSQSQRDLATEQLNNRELMLQSEEEDKKQDK